MCTSCASGQSTYSDYHFKSTAELAKVLESKAGWSCARGLNDDEAGTASSLGEYGYTQMPCANGSIGLFVSDAKRTEVWAKPWNTLKAGNARIDGGNWSVSGTQYLVEDALKVLGGKLTRG